MPQMSPMLWSLLFLFFIFLFMFFNILNYFNFIPSYKNLNTEMNKQQIKQNIFNWKW
uniref:ATP synthase F0 subunit 8 n=1 Tax=Endochironomus pekanus TaxID=1366567 RepID=UPI0023F24396|nr:ATP synthase F0 subunit 8 [Endochironomus pekanus]WEF49655.1 ATP synthase F0 subunit 8 [Endochironomus pekanus]